MKPFPFTKNAAFFASIAVLAIAAPSHAFLGAAKVESLWRAKPVQVDGRAVEWPESPVVEESGLSFRAMNDESNLYLLIRGSNADGRIVLSGKYRQNVTLWFLKSDHKTKDWGINIDFDRAAPIVATATGTAVEAAPTLAALGLSPEIVIPQGLEISTATFPQEIELQADLSSQRGRQPVYEMRIPFRLIKQESGQSLSITFSSSEVSPEVKAELQANSRSTAAGGVSGSPTGGAGAPAGGHGRGGGRRGRGMGGAPGGGNKSNAVELPKPLQLQLTIRLAKAPK